jgi:hypothetical protein
MHIPMKINGVGKIIVKIYTFLAFSNLVARVFRLFLAIYNHPMVHHIFLIC